MIIIFYIVSVLFEMFEDNALQNTTQKKIGQKKQHEDFRFVLLKLFIYILVAFTI